MMGIGFTEMLVIGILVLLLFGPDKIPTVAKTLAKIYREVRTTGAEFTRAVRTELDSVTGDTREELRKARTDLNAATSGLLAGRFGDSVAPNSAGSNHTASHAVPPRSPAAQAPVPPQWLETVVVPYPGDSDAVQGPATPQNHG